MAETAPQRSTILIATLTATLTLAGAVTVAGLFGWIRKTEPTSSPPSTVFVPITPSAAPPAVIETVEPAAEVELASKKHHKHHEKHEHEEHDDDDD